MLKSITFTVPGNPIALKRHRTTKTGNNYDPSAGDKADFLAKAMLSKPDKPMEGPLKLTIDFYFGRLTTHFTKKGLRPSAPKYRVARPDIDNLEKFVYDALNGIYFKNDSQVVISMSSKRYSDQPCVCVKIEELE